MSGQVRGSLVRRRQLGARLREYREATGLSMDDVAARIGLRQGSISRIERGRQAILPRTVTALAAVYKIPPAEVEQLVEEAEASAVRGWWVQFGDTVPGWFERYVDLETDATAISTYEAEVVPGLLQDAEYARAVVALDPQADIERAVELRLARQQRLETRPPTMHAVLNEAVLRRGMTAGQIRHLIEVSRQPWLTLQVLPFAVGFHPAVASGSFSLLTLPDAHRPSVVYVQHRGGAVYLDRPLDLERYRQVTERLRQQALTPAATRGWLATLLDE